ncbi:hypothetical protein [Roseateles chitosanitabidus]|jgi:hypothetical protein|uniref:hypothetical protein n=1 Tax=Roseateles chitosanitabidus TaxID=65048 RepID=UPI0008304271|nr:hypothetical protein [Roseateles chitosanitabidus]
MKAPARLGGSTPLPRPDDRLSGSSPDVSGHAWRRALLRAGGVVLAALLVWAVVTLLDRAEGDLSLVASPAFETAATTLC